MKIVNKKTGEVIDLSSKGQPSKTKEAQTDDRIKDRGTIQDSVKNVSTEDSLVKKAIAGAEVADAPFAAVESAIANVGLKAQKGEAPSGPMAMSGPIGAVAGGGDNIKDVRDMGKVIKEALLGASLQKQGQYGDIMKNAGYNPILADTAGLVLHASPLKIYSEAVKTFGAISKMSDKAMLKAGDNLVMAVNQARDAIGTKVTQEFAKGADNVPVDGLAFIKDLDRLPGPVLARAEEAFGDISEFAKGLNVGKLREFKRFLGKLKPNDYGKGERGLNETLEVKDLQKTYSNIKKRMIDSLSKPESGVDKKQINKLLELEESYSDVSDAGRYIRKSITDPVLQIPSKVGEFSKKISSDTDASARVALSTVKKASQKAMNRINSAMRTIEGFDRNQNMKKVAGAVARAGFYTGVGGMIAGQSAKAFNQEN